MIKETTTLNNLNKNTKRVLVVIVVKLLKKQGRSKEAKELISLYRELYSGMFSKDL